ncbi:aminotransferase [Dunaliella salina]|uniref:Aminotransferase n=1 Tax=Dunaliella salina TaxID=3046 RepID=A0ABQ7GZ82_DUNSA|nr:aminotransferase [Dunaliella salina]|eukprot:KAF5839912.1 aminotransferase [Dunaliella salina]
MAGLEVWRSDAVLMRVLLDTAAASRKLNGIIKFWLTPGRGGFGLAPDECTEVGFYALATSEIVPKIDLLDKLSGYKACTSPIPPNKGRLAQIKSNNYLRNTLVLTDARENGYDVGLFVDEEGHILEGPNMNIGIITQDDVFVTPPFDNCLAGVTMQRVMELIPGERERSPDDVIVSDIQQRPITEEDMLKAKEAFLTGSTLGVMPVVSINGEPIGEDGKPGITALAFDAMLVEDMKVPESGERTQHIPVPFGRTTGMLEHLQ